MKEERADRNRSPSTIARTGPFCYSRAWKPLTPTTGPGEENDRRVLLNSVPVHSNRVSVKPNSASHRSPSRQMACLALLLPFSLVCGWKGVSGNSSLTISMSCPASDVCGSEEHQACVPVFQAHLSLGARLHLGLIPFPNVRHPAEVFFLFTW